jgi:glycosyltransferase involved in cell wall biosynthesis
VKKGILIILENSCIPLDPRVWNEARALRQNGYEVTVLCPKTKNYSKGYECIDGIHIYRHPMPDPGGGILGYILEYSAALFFEMLFASWIYFRRGFKVIQGCNPPDTIVFVALPFRLLGVKYIFDHHDASPELYLAKFSKNGLLFSTLTFFEKLTYRFSDAVIVTNNSYKSLALKRGHRKPEDVFVVRNGPDPERFKVVPAQPELRNGKPYLVGYVGHMDVQDGLDILLDVAAHIKQMGRNDVHFTCVGGGPSLPALRQMVREKALESTVTFSGRVSDEALLNVLSTADVCVNPDKPCEMNNISTMIKIMEYMSLGKPIVQFECVEGRFSAGDASLYASPQNMVNDFACKILWLLDHPEERKRMGDLGRRRVEDELAWKFSVNDLLAAYERALSK